MNNIETMQKAASQIRRDIVRMVGKAGSGHPGGSLGSTDVIAALYFGVMKHDPKNWSRSCKGQDAFVLSAGHLAPVYYSTLARAGYFPVEELGTLRKFGTRLQGHPSIEHGLPGVIQASGSLGQGLSCAAGLAIAKKMDAEDTRVFCHMGDGESEEGQVWEAAMFAANHKLDNLVGITDWNGLQIDGDVNVVGGIGDLEAKWKAFGWNVIVVEKGNDMASIVAAFEDAAKVKGCPTMILLRTTMGCGVDFMEGKHGWHGKAPKPEEVELAMAQLPETLGDF